MTTHTAIMWREEDVWFAEFPGVAGCHTYGRSFQAAQRAARLALLLYVDAREPTHVRFDVIPPDAAQPAIDRLKRARKQVERAQKQVRAAVIDALVTLTEQEQWSFREAAGAVGLSFQRVYQLYAEAFPGKRPETEERLGA